MGAGLTAYGSALADLFARTGSRVEPGLERTAELLDELGEPHRRLAVFHVAGTNGKGSTCATLDALLRAEGRSVGRFTSPHLVDFRERILVDGAPIAEEEVLAWLARLGPVAERTGATFFEITTAMALGYFAERGVDAVVLETGMGGALDSTNVVDPLVAGVTSIGMDHTEHLGGTLPEIADQKAGIFKFGRPAVIGEHRSDLARRLADRAAERGASRIVVTRSDWRAWGIEVRGSGTAFSAQTPHGEVRLKTTLVGEHQVQNTLTALAMLDAAGADWYPKAPVRQRGLASVALPGRLQRVRDWLLDVAHNRDGMRVVVNALSDLHVARPVTALVGVLGDKDWRGILDELAPAVDAFVVTQPGSASAERSWDPLAAATYAHGLGVPTTLEVSFEMALLRAEAQPGTKLVTGSFHTVGDAMRRLGIVPLAPARR